MSRQAAYGRAGAGTRSLADVPPAEDAVAAKVEVEVVGVGAGAVAEEEANRTRF